MQSEKAAFFVEKKVKKINTYKSVKIIRENYMEEDFNWNLASNAQLKEECERLEKLFEEKQEQMRETVSRIDEINKQLVKLSQQFLERKKILDKREGKK